MSCALTQGYTLDCRDSVGGIKTLYLIEFDNVSSIATASGNVTGITKASTKRFWKYNLEHNTSTTNNEYTGSRENGTFFVAQSITAILNKMQASVRNEIVLLSKNRIIAVVTDKNDNSWLYGKDNGLMLNAGNSTPGTAMGDRNGYTLTFNGEEKEEANFVNTSVVSTLETPG